MSGAADGGAHAPRFQPPRAEPVDLGPVSTPTGPAPAGPMDEFLTDLYGPGAEPLPLIAAEPARHPRTESRFPPLMWGWAAGTLLLAIAAILLILG